MTKFFAILVSVLVWTKWMKEAIPQSLEMKAPRDVVKNEAIASFDWLDAWGTDKKTVIPTCHK